MNGPTMLIKFRTEARLRLTGAREFHNILDPQKAVHILH